MTRMGEVVDHPVKLRAEVWRTVGAVIAITGAMALGIFILRGWVVHVVFSKAFTQVADLLPLQLLGDVLRMGAWILSMVLVALVRSRWFISLTVIVGVVYAGAAKLLIPTMGIEGAVVAYLISGAAHMILGGIALRDVLFTASPRKALTPAVKEN
jgi:PST family polysaccharide transporter